MMKRKLIIRYMFLGVLLLLVWMTQSIPTLGSLYSQTIYPVVSRFLPFFSNLFPFVMGGLLIFGSTTGVIVYPFYARVRKRLPQKKVLLRDREYLLWVYVWFYLAWELSYSQPDFYQRTHIPYTIYTSEIFQESVDDYIDSLNSSFVPVKGIHEEQVRDRAVKLCNQLSDSLRVHRPPFPSPWVKTMVFAPSTSMVGMTGSVGPFFCEFALSGDLLPINYPAAYTHELAHLLGVSNEVEANFHAYQICARLQVEGIHFSGYFSILNHVLRNVRWLLDEKEYADIVNRIRPEIIELARKNRGYWMAEYSPLIGDVRDWIYDLYLKGNKIEGGRRNYSEVIGLLISYQVWRVKNTSGQ